MADEVCFIKMKSGITNDIAISGMYSKTRKNNKLQNLGTFLGNNINVQQCTTNDTTHNGNERNNLHNKRIK